MISGHHNSLVKYAKKLQNSSDEKKLASLGSKIEKSADFNSLQDVIDFFAQLTKQEGVTVVAWRDRRILSWEVADKYPNDYWRHHRKLGLAFADKFKHAKAACLFIALKTKNAILAHVNDFSDLIKLPSPVIAALLGYPSDLLERFIKTPKQLEELLRTMGPSAEFEMVIESIDLRWLRKLFDGKDLVADANQLDSFMGAAFPSSAQVAILNSLDHKWLMKLYNTNENSNFKSFVDSIVKSDGQSAVQFLESNKKDKHHDNHTFFRQPHLEETMQGQTRNKGVCTAEFYATKTLKEKIDIEGLPKEFRTVYLMDHS